MENLTHQTEPEVTINPRPKYMECLECHTVHVVVDSINDDRPTCKCGSDRFAPRDKGVPGYMPEFCDQNKDKDVWDGVMAVVLGPIHDWKSRMEEKHGITFTKGDLQDLARSMSIVGKSMVNTSRDGFVKDRFIKHLQGHFRSFLYARKRKPKNKA